MPRKQLTHIDLFAGIGGFSLGFAQAGIQTIAHVEVDVNCRSILKRHWPDNLILDDVLRCGAHNLPRADIISFGSPCQDLSIAGKRAGLKGVRSGLFHEAVRIVAELKSAFAIWENVPGALSSNAGRDFAAVLGAFRECGARDIAWRILDAQYFGVAQRRRRLFVVADFRDERAAQILFEPERGTWHPAQGKEARARIAGSIAASAGHHGYSSPRGDGNDNLITPEVSGTLTSLYAKQSGNALQQQGALIAVNNFGERATSSALTTSQHRIDGDTETFVIAQNGSDVQATDKPGAMGAEQRGTNVDLVAFALRGRDEGAQVEVSGDRTSSLRGSEGGSSRDYIGFIPRRTNVNPLDDQSPTHNTGSGGFGAPGVAGPMGVRRLMPVECERLQGFPDGWTDGQSDSVRYHQLGNAVAVPVAKWIGTGIVRVSIDRVEGNR